MLDKILTDINNIETIHTYSQEKIINAYEPPYKWLEKGTLIEHTFNKITKPTITIYNKEYNIKELQNKLDNIHTLSNPITKIICKLLYKLTKKTIDKKIKESNDTIIETEIHFYQIQESAFYKIAYADNIKSKLRTTPYIEDTIPRTEIQDMILPNNMRASLKDKCLYMKPYLKITFKTGPIPYYKYFDSQTELNKYIKQFKKLHTIIA